MTFFDDQVKSAAESWKKGDKAQFRKTVHHLVSENGDKQKTLTQLAAVAKACKTPRK